MIKKIILGKKYKTMNKYEKIKFLEKEVLISFFGSIFFLLAFLIVSILFFKSEIIIYESNVGNFEDLNITLEIDNLTIQEEEKIKKIMSNIKPIYLINQGKIIFTKNMNKYYSKCPRCRGVNIDNGQNIIIRYQEEMRMKNTICHELLHTYFSGLRYDDEQSLVIDLSTYLPCFNEKEKMER